MSEPIDRLSRFTPDATGLDRDRLLFEAGRAAARPNRRWRAVCAALSASQLLTLTVLCWPRPVEPPVHPMPLLVKQAPQTAPPASLWHLRDQALVNDGNLPSLPPTEQVAAVQTPLHAFGALPKSLIE
jgi:hypothetical protein